MQIGKKVVKVQKIVMTKAELEEMTKKGLVEMKVRIRPNLSHVMWGRFNMFFLPLTPVSRHTLIRLTPFLLMSPYKKEVISENRSVY